MRRVSAGAAISIALAGVIAVAAVSLLRPKSVNDGGLPADCGTTPSAYHPGAIIDWPGSGATTAKTAGGASADHFARVRFDSGRMVLAYNTTPAKPAIGTRVVVAEIRCVHRTIHLLTELGAPTAPAMPPRDGRSGHLQWLRSTSLARIDPGSANGIVRAAATPGFGRSRVHLFRVRFT